jgi:hypothetical protein
VTRPFRIERERFLLLVTAIASMSCTDGRPGIEPPVRPDARVSTVPPARVPDLEPPLESVEAPALVPEPVRDAPACDNDVGTVDCSDVARHDVGGPACEGLTGACELLAGGYGYAPRVAQEIAACWARLGRDACDNRKRGRCNEEALQHACPDPRFESQCSAILERCEAAGARIELTLETCVKALSGMTGDERSWAAGQMGPAQEGAGPVRCRLMHPIW